MTSAAQLLSEQDHRDTWSLTIGKDMSDEDIEFVREAGAKLRELSQRYRAALREMVVRFEILDQDLNLRKDRTPIHHVESRVKTPESIIEKIGRYGKERTLENIEKYIMDIAGIRVNLLLYQRRVQPVRPAATPGRPGNRHGQRLYC